MADIRISALPTETTPSGSDWVPVDLASTRKTTVTNLVVAGRPTASQAEAEAGTDPTKAMTPLTTAQAIAFQVGIGFVPLSRTLTAGVGLTGGGNLTVDRTFDVDFTEVQAFSTKLTNIDGASFAAGSMLIATGVDTFTSIPVGAANQVLQIIAGLPTWTNVASGGDVTGPASSVTGSIVSYNGTTGKIIQAGNPTVADLLASTAGPAPTITNDTTDAANDIVFSAGAAFSVDATKWPMVGASRIKQLDAAWAVGTNAGGRMSAAAIANTTYYCYMIRRPDTGVVDYGFDVSATAPTLPANYTQYKLIGAIVRVAAAIKPFIQDGPRFMWRTPATDVNVVNPGTAAVARTLTVPIGLRVKALMSVGFNANAGSVDNPLGIYISDLSLADVAPGLSSAVSTETFLNSALNIAAGSMVEAMTSTSGQVRTRVGSSTAGTTLYINTYGFEIIGL